MRMQIRAHKGTPIFPVALYPNFYFLAEVYIAYLFHFTVYKACNIVNINVMCLHKIR